MDNGNDAFVITENIRHFQKLLEGEPNPDRRNVLHQLLATEMEKLPKPARQPWHG